MTEGRRAALDLVLSRKLGRAFTSDYVLGEAVTLARVRTGSLRDAKAIADRVLGRPPVPRVFDLLMVTGPIFRDAVRIFESYEDKLLSFTDGTSVALIRRRGIDRILSFDGDFDGIVERMDPRSATKA